MQQDFMQWLQLDRSRLNSGLERNHQASCSFHATSPQSRRTVHLHGVRSWCALRVTGMNALYGCIGVVKPRMALR